MALHPIEPENAWIEALQYASRRLPPGDPLAQLFHEDREDLRIVVENDQVQEIVGTRARGLSARARSGLVYRSEPDPEDASILAAQVAGSREVPVGGSRTSDATVHLSTTDALRFAGELIAEVSRNAKADPVRAQVRWVGFRQSVSVGRPDGTVRSDVRQGSRVRLEVEFAHERSRGRAVVEASLRQGTAGAIPELAARVCRRARERLEVRSAPRGETSVVFAPGVGGVLVHEIVGHALEADTVLSRMSMLAAAGGDIAPPDVTIVDDPRRGRAPWRIDDEGEEARSVALVREGRVAASVSDLTRQASGGIASTGHGRRASFHQPVLPRLGCTFLAPGTLDPREVLDRLERGVLVRRMEAAGTDPRAGRALFRVTDADQIRAGKIECALQPFLLEVRTTEALSTLDRIATDLELDACIGSCVRDGQPLATSVGAPTCRIRSARVLC